MGTRKRSLNNKTQLHVFSHAARLDANHDVVNDTHCRARSTGSGAPVAPRLAFASTSPGGRTRRYSPPGGALCHAPGTAHVAGMIRFAAQALALHARARARVCVRACVRAYVCVCVCVCVCVAALAPAVEVAPCRRVAPPLTIRHGAPGCEDTAGWTNGDRPGGALSCGDYVSKGHCASGRLLTAWAGGSAFNHPQQHCCACGKADHESPYTASYVRGLFQPLRLPKRPSGAAVLRAFEAAPNSSTTNAFLVLIDRGHVWTIAPRVSRLDCPTTKRRPTSTWRCGFDAWQRFARFLYYLFAATLLPEPLPRTLLLVHMDEVVLEPLVDPQHTAAVPQLGTYSAPCLAMVPVPFPLKGFGALDFAERLRRRGERWWHAEQTPWERREARAVWRGCSRRLPAACNTAGASGPAAASDAALA